MKDIFETKVCLAKSHSEEACNGKIIAAHTIPRSQLSKIAVDGHVYSIAGTPADLARNNGALSAKKVGINSFSVLNCFCASHDNNIFAHVEDDPLVFDPHQITLLHFRSIASEMYRKITAYHTTLHHLEEQQKDKRKNKNAIEFLMAHAAGQLVGIRDIGPIYNRCAKSLFSKNYADVKAAVVHFKKLPTIMTVGGFMPQFGYEGGKRLQDLNEVNTVAQALSFNVLAAEEHAVVALCWFANHDIVKSFVDTYLAQNPEKYTTLAIQTAFEYLENTCMAPTWWEAEKPIVRKLLIDRMQGGANLLEPRPASCLTFCGVGFDQWDYDRHEFIN